MSAGLTVAQQTLVHVIGAAEVDDHDVLRFEDIVAALHWKPHRGCHAQLVQPGAHVVAGQVADPEAVRNLAGGVLLPV